MLNRNLFIPIIALFFLTVFLILGTPFEFKIEQEDTIATLVQGFLVVIFFAIIVYFSKKITRKLLKIVIFTVTSFLGILYILNGIWISLILTSNYHPMWQDLIVYENKSGTKIIKQWRRTSGSIYDYRTKRIIADYGSFKVFIPANTDNLEGVWKVNQIENNIIEDINFTKKK
jgi:hypothetical protein